MGGGNNGFYIHYSVAAKLHLFTHCYVGNFVKYDAKE